MLLQRSFKKNYTEALLETVRSGQDLDKYANDSFDYDHSQVVMIPSVQYPNGLIKKLVPTPQGDFESAIALYEAYSELTPLQAADKSFWAYLAHVDLFEYVQARYPKVKEHGFNNIQYVVDHWFCGTDWHWRHPLASLWWFVYQTIDETNKDNKYKYTRFFFSNYAFRTNLAKYTFARLKEALFGYFDFLMDNPAIMSQHFKPRNLLMTKHLNKLGGSRLLSTLDRQTFYNELCTINDDVLAINSTSKKDKEEEEQEAEMFEYEYDYDEEINPDTVAEPTQIRMGGKRVVTNPPTRLRINMPDGSIIEERAAWASLHKFVLKVGVDKARTAGIISNKLPLISNTVDKKYEKAQKPLGNGWFLMTCSDTITKRKQILAIAAHIGMKINVEII